MIYATETRRTRPDRYDEYTVVVPMRPQDWKRAIDVDLAYNESAGIPVNHKRMVYVHPEGPKTRRHTEFWAERLKQAAEILAREYLRIEEEDGLPLENVARSKIGEPPHLTYDAWWNELYIERLLTFDYLEPVTPRQRRESAIHGS